MRASSWVFVNGVAAMENGKLRSQEWARVKE